MLRAIRDLQHYRIHAIDGPIGRVHELYFDDQQWRVRHIVVTTGGWLPRHRVLIPTACVLCISEGSREVRVTLTRDQVAASPNIDTERPVSRQHEGELYWHYGFTGVPLPIGQVRKGNPHLRRTREVVGYALHRDHDWIGGVDDFLVDGASWTICYLVADVGRGWLEKKVLVLPRTILEIIWEENAVRVDLSRAVLRNAPRFDAGRPIDRDVEAQILEYYGSAESPAPSPDRRDGLKPESCGSRAAA